MSTPDDPTGGLDPPPDGDGSFDSVPIHPDDRLWRHPSERLHLAASPVVTAPSPGTSAIPTPLVVAVGMVALLATAGTLAWLSGRGRPTTVVTSGAAPSTTMTRPELRIGSSAVPALMIDPDGVVIAGVAQAPTRVSIRSGRTRGWASLVLADPGASLAFYRLDADQFLAGTPTRYHRVAEVAPATVPFDTLVVTNVGVLPGLRPRSPLAPGEPIGVNGEILAVGVRSADGAPLAVSWRALRSVVQSFDHHDGDDPHLPVEVKVRGSNLVVTDSDVSAIHVGDELTHVDGVPVAVTSDGQWAELRAWLERTHRGDDTFTLTCSRGGRPVSVTVSD